MYGICHHFSELFEHSHFPGLKQDNSNVLIIIACMLTVHVPLALAARTYYGDEA